MRALPGLTVIDPVDATEFAAAVEAAVELPGTVYVRGLRGRVAELLPPDSYRFVPGATVPLRNGGETALIGTGLGTAWALEAAELIGEGLSLLHIPTLKPADLAAIAEFCTPFAEVTTVENHSTVGGLASVVSEAVATHGLATRVRALGVPDAWAPAGTIGYIRSQLGLDAEGIAAAVTTAREIA